MAETLQLRYQVCDEAPRDLHNVTGVELYDGTKLRGAEYDPGKPEAEMTLEWPAEMAQRVTDFYARHLTTPDPANLRDGWNCHSFVAAAMGWEVYWGGACPYFMPRGFRSIAPEQLQDQQPYANSSFIGGFQHSFIGLPDPAYNLAVWAFRYPLRIATTAHTREVYGAQIREHRTPVHALGRLAARVLPFCSDKMPKNL